LHLRDFFEQQQQQQLEQNTMQSPTAGRIKQTANAAKNSPITVKTPKN